MACADFSFIVVAHNCSHLLARCLASIRKTIIETSESCRSEIIIVNTGTEPVSASDDAVVISVKRNCGFGVACNLGARRASGHVLVFLNADVELLIFRGIDILRRFAQDKRIGLIAPQVVEDGVPISSLRTFPSLQSDLARELGFREAGVQVGANGCFAGWAGGMALIVRASAFLGFGGFDEGFFLYYEDVDLGKRFHNAGIDQVYDPSIVVLHVSGGSSAELGWRKTALRYESKQYYMSRHLSTGELAAHIVFILLLLMAKTAAGIFFSRTRGHIPAYLFGVRVYLMAASDALSGRKRTRDNAAELRRRIVGL